MPKSEDAMPSPSFEELKIGEEIPPLNTLPISRLTLALFAGASGDHNPIHVDLDYARAAGMDDVLAHGMLVMAYVARLLTNWAPPESIRRFSVRFASITRVHDQITCLGKVVAKKQANGEKLVQLEVKAINQVSDVKLIGEAVLALS